ncbi:hypothetical protein N5D79_17165 [Pseudomonas sp. GD03817]|uniref:Uncharacterized protein n=1 Tax=Pseudomonas asiatica TaxID=2219225 RepID=A0AAJ5LL60_9PSED|nr:MULTISPECIES: hypothetical protein [Pseudomonas]MCE0990477.1 hypothetical protein [Pseudomonas alloputida]MDH1401840.1 hypothetical protein [Pseudomonas sp. GD03730]MDH1776605.1 hypothetical protein [Pseudomonas sp. GD03817]MEE1915490.1 hypothetical protein [Pseudomonas asiatica]QKL10252.1 hypothetical protein GEV41_29235 [Pseudomonas putida]
MSLETIKTLVDELTTLHVTRGVQPSELVDNLFEDDYVESSARKTSAGLIFELTFTESVEEELSSKVTMRYTYDHNRHLVLVEQKVAAKRFSVQWDRARAVQERIEKLEALLSGRLPEAQVARILATMPKDYLALAPRLQLVA